MSLKLLLTSETVYRWWKMPFLRETRYEIEDDFVKLLYDKMRVEIEILVSSVFMRMINWLVKYIGVRLRICDGLRI